MQRKELRRPIALSGDNRLRSAPHRLPRYPTLLQCATGCSKPPRCKYCRLCCTDFRGGALDPSTQQRPPFVVNACWYSLRLHRLNCIGRKLEAQ